MVIRNAMYAKHRRYLLVLGVLFAIVGIALAIEPRHRADWALENALVAAFVVLVALTSRRFILSRVSYTLIFLFLCLHEIGAHYTYSEVPYERWFQALSGASLNGLLGWERNNFDRVIHFCYGLMLAYRDGRCVGFCRNERHATRGEIGVLGTTHDARGIGLGRALLRWGVGWLEAHVPGPVTLLVDGDNEGALALYKSEGFEVSRTRRIWGRVIETRS